MKPVVTERKYIAIAGENVCRSMETDCNRPMWKITEQETSITTALTKHKVIEPIETVCVGQALCVGKW